MTGRKKSVLLPWLSFFAGKTPILQTEKNTKLEIFTLFFFSKLLFSKNLFSFCLAQNSVTLWFHVNKSTIAEEKVPWSLVKHQLELPLLCQQKVWSEHSSFLLSPYNQGKKGLPQASICKKAVEKSRILDKISLQLFHLFGLHSHAELFKSLLLRSQVTLEHLPFFFTLFMHHLCPLLGLLLHQLQNVRVSAKVTSTRETESLACFF